MTRSWHWLDAAACAGSTDRVWVQPRNHSTPAQLEHARTTCLTCPVIPQCLHHHQHQPAFEGYAAARSFDGQHLRPPVASGKTATRKASA